VEEKWRRRDNNRHRHILDKIDGRVRNGDEGKHFSNDRRFLLTTTNAGLYRPFLVVILNHTLFSLVLNHFLAVA